MNLKYGIWFYGFAELTGLVVRFENETGGLVEFKDISAQWRFGVFKLKNVGLADIRIGVSHDAGSEDDHDCLW